MGKLWHERCKFIQGELVGLFVQYLSYKTFEVSKLAFCFFLFKTDNFQKINTFLADKSYNQGNLYNTFTLKFELPSLFSEKSCSSAKNQVCAS